MDANADARSSSSPMHIVIFPWLAFGHMIPLLELAERLVARGHRVSFVSTPRNLSRLRPVVGVHFVALPLPRVDGLPEGAEATSDLPPSPGNLAELLLKAADGLVGPFSAFLDEGKKPDWLVLDNLHYLAAAAAADRGVPSVMFLPFAAASTALWGVPRVSTVVDPELGATVPQRFVLTYQCCKIVAQRCCVEFDPEAVPLLPGVLGKPFAPMGLLPPPPLRASSNNEGDELVSWLDRHPAKSVVYVALGTEAPLTTELVHELAIGLELAGTPFLWALRKVGDQDVLPPGFEERIKGRGLVAMGMVPQTRVLAHGSVGAFLTHSGPGSAIEGIQYGHPLVMLPFFGDQQTGAQFMERKKVGLLVPRNGEDGLSFDRQGVASTVRAVVVDEQAGRVFAANANKWQQVVADTACHERYIDEFVQQLRFYKDQ
ncbi:UDP-glycosyltransferase 91B1-like [Triticum urartu]|uniref:Glycosyltransferase n=1 Tax=Triticum urartu TaxID=4572 RepID=A0A8R7QHK7_TRIUA|nr:UDP-glycosyltransferase 91B1-like [Triticum urartu]XP_048531191.1 UDP-glycosyltransferase 91B1-like [Triticum urartu]